MKEPSRCSGNAGWDRFSVTDHPFLGRRTNAMLEWTIAAGYVMLAWMLMHLPRIGVTRRFGQDARRSNVPVILPLGLLLLGVNVQCDFHHVLHRWWLTVDGGQVRDVARSEIAWIGVAVVGIMVVVAGVGMARWKLRGWIMIGLGVALAMEVARGVLLIGGREHPYEGWLCVIEIAGLAVAMFGWPLLRRSKMASAGQTWRLAH